MSTESTYSTAQEALEEIRNNILAMVVERNPAVENQLLKTTFDTMIHELSVGAMEKVSEGGEATIFAQTKQGPVVHTGSIVPRGQAIVMGVDTTRIDNKGRYYFASATVLLPDLDENYQKRMESYLEEVRKHLHVDDDEPLMPLAGAATRAAAEHLLDLLGGKGVIDREEVAGTANNLVNLLLFLLEGYKAKDEWVRMGTEGIVLGICAIITEDKTLTIIVPMDIALPDALVELVHGDAA